MIGKTISHYRIIEKLGGGGMGIVYQAEDCKLKRIAVINFLTRDREIRQLERTVLLPEAQAAPLLDHPAIWPDHKKIAPLNQ